MDQMLMAHPRIYSKAFAQGSSHSAKWKAVSVSQEKLYIYVSANGCTPCAGACRALYNGLLVCIYMVCIYMGSCSL